MLWFSYKEDPGNWHVLSKDQVNEILQKNKKKEKVASLEMYAMEIVVEEKVVFENVVGQDSLTRFDKPKGGGNRNKNRNKNKNRNRNKNKNRNRNRNQKKNA